MPDLTALDIEELQVDWISAGPFAGDVEGSLVGIGGDLEVQIESIFEGHRLTNSRHGNGKVGLGKDHRAYTKREIGIGGEEVQAVVKRRIGIAWTTLLPSPTMPILRLTTA